MKKIRVVLDLDVETTETSGAIIDRLAVFDFSSLSGSFDDVMDEVADIKDIELHDINAVE